MTRLAVSPSAYHLRVVFLASCWPAGVLAGVWLGSVTSQPVGIEQWFDGYTSNTAQAIVSAASLTDSNMIVEIFRLDGTLVDIGSASVNQFQGWIPAGDVPWQLGTEDVLLYRLTTTAAGPLLVDSAIVGTSP